MTVAEDRLREYLLQRSWDSLNELARRRNSDPRQFGAGWRRVVELAQSHQASAGDGQAQCNGEPEQEEGDRQ